MHNFMCGTMLMEKGQREPILNCAMGSFSSFSNIHPMSTIFRCDSSYPQWQLDLKAFMTFKCSGLLYQQSNNIQWINNYCNFGSLYRILHAIYVGWGLYLYCTSCSNLCLCSEWMSLCPRSVASEKRPFVFPLFGSGDMTWSAPYWSIAHNHNSNNGILDTTFWFIVVTFPDLLEYQSGKVT